MRFQPILVPGWQDLGPGHWQAHWLHSLPHARRLPPPAGPAPDPARWQADLATCVDSARWPVLLIAHDVGCLVVAGLPVPLCGRVAGALLVAPTDVEHPATPPSLRGFAPIARRPLSFQSVLVAGDADPRCSAERARQLAADWGSRLVLAPQAAHFDDCEGDSWPQGLKLLAALRRRAAWRITPPQPRVPPVPCPNVVS